MSAWSDYCCNVEYYYHSNLILGFRLASHVLRYNWFSTVESSLDMFHCSEKGNCVFSVYSPLSFQCLLQLVLFHLKEDFLSNFVLILIILILSLWVLYYTWKLWNARFWTTLCFSFTCYQEKFNLLKSSLWICHLKMIEMYKIMYKKFSFTSAVIWWSSTLESCELFILILLFRSLRSISLCWQHIVLNELTTKVRKV